jgi:hypothetical protein
MRKSKNEIDTWNIWEYFIEEEKHEKQNKSPQRAATKNKRQNVIYESNTEGSE